MAKKEDGNGSKTKLWIGIVASALGILVIILTTSANWGKFKATTESTTASVKTATDDRKEIRQQTVDCMLLLTKTATILDGHVKEGVQERMYHQEFRTEYRAGVVEQKSDMRDLRENVKKLTEKIDGLH